MSKTIIQMADVPNSNHQVFSKEAIKEAVDSWNKDKTKEFKISIDEDGNAYILDILSIIEGGFISEKKPSNSL